MSTNIESPEAAAQLSPAQEMRRLVLVQLAARGWGISHLAKAIGKSQPLVSNVLLGVEPNPRVRRRIECLLRMPFWSTEEEFNTANRVRKILGCDPIISPTPALLKSAVMLGIIEEDVYLSRRELLELVGRMPEPAETAMAAPVAPDEPPDAPKSGGPLDIIDNAIDGAVRKAGKLLREYQRRVREGSAVPAAPPTPALPASPITLTLETVEGEAR